MSSNKIKCELCGEEFKRLGPHLRQRHGYSKDDQKEYYDKYLKKDGEDKCLQCGQDTLFRDITKGYRQFCSPQCSNKNSSKKEKTIETNLKRYGVKSAIQNKEIQEKIRKTNLERYGVEVPIQNKEILEKIKKTNLEKFGVEWATSSAEVKEKIKKTNLDRYGVEYPWQSEIIQEKSKETNLAKYGVEYPLQSSEIKEKIEQTNLKRYGVKTPLESLEIQKKIQETVFKKYFDTNIDSVESAFYMSTKDFKNKSKETMLERYGTEHPMHSTLIQERMKQTNLERYGVENVLFSHGVRKKIEETNIEKYGVPHIGSSLEIREKIRRSNLERYGVDCIFKSPEFKERISKTNIEKYGTNSGAKIHIKNVKDWDNLYQFLIEHDQEFSSVNLSNYFGVTYKTVRKRITELGLQKYVKEFYSLSEPEQAFAQELDKLNIDYELHNRKVIAPLEVDFYLAKYKLAIEISPTWTHQYITEEETTQNFMGVTDQDYHYNKFKLCKEQGIELITVFDWTDQEKVMNFIKSKIEPAQTIYARKTTAKLLQGLTKDHKDFLERNHILGSINNSQTTEVVELHYDSKIIGLAVFEQKKNYTELRRLVFEQGYRVQGGASKLIKTFTRNHTELKELVTFSDNDLGRGNVYKQLGFQVLEENQGTLIWYNEQYDKKIPNLSLVKQGTDRLLKNFTDYEYVGQGEDLPSNQEIIQQYGFVPVYDCGYTKWVLILK